MSRLLAVVCSLAVGVALAAAAEEPQAASAELSPRSEEIMVLGVFHLNEKIIDAAKPGSLAAINRSLIGWRPNAVIVEWLPADWPAGEGRDYRHLGDVETLANLWRLELDGSAERLEQLLDEPLVQRDLILAGKLFYLTGDQLNAAYYWWMADKNGLATAELSGLTHDNLKHNEQGVHGFEIAFALAHDRVYSFDYQGDDASWLLGTAMEEAESEGTAEDIAQMEALNAETGVIKRLLADVDTADLVAFYRVLNGEEWMELQHWAHHEIYPQIRFRAYGLRLTANLELRNARMFEYVERAIRDAKAQRTLVLVGAGHKYFLDKRVEWYGYTWVDPLDVLPGN